MSEIPNWFERHFQFPFPVEFLPNLKARLVGTPPRLEEALGCIPENARVARRSGKWSAQEHAGHLLELEPLWLARLDDFSLGSEELTKADLTNRGTDEGKYNEQRLEDVLRTFRAARSSLVARLLDINPQMLTRAIPHPRLRTPMRLADHLFFVAEHDDHHLAHILQISG